MTPPLILGIETSCDETSAALVGSEEGLLSGTDAASDNFLSDIERLVRGSEADRAKAIALLKSRGGQIKRKVLDTPPDEDDF